MDWVMVISLAPERWKWGVRGRCGQAAPAFARASAHSFPGTPLCPLTHLKEVGVS